MQINPVEMKEPGCRTKQTQRSPLQHPEPTSGTISTFDREGASSSAASALSGFPGKAAANSQLQERKGEGGGIENPVTSLQVSSS